MPKIIIRRMKILDIDTIYEIETETFATPWSKSSFVKEITDNVSARYLVIEKDGKLLGYAGTWIVFEESHITNIAISEKYRGLGYGSKLTKAILQYCANLAVQYVTLEVRRSNLIAQKMYKTLGFEELGVRKRYYEDNNEDALLMVLTHMPAIQEDFDDNIEIFDEFEE